MRDRSDFRNLRNLGLSSARTPPIIAGTNPSIQQIVDGQTVADALVAWGTASSSAAPGTEIVTQEMRIDGAAYQAYNGATVLDYTQTLRLRKRVTDGVGTPERIFESNIITVSALAPSAFTIGQWDLNNVPSAGSNKLEIDILTLTDDGGAPFTALQYRVDSGSGYGAAQTLSGTGTGAREITVLAETAASVQIRAVNAIGNGDWSDVKTETPTLLDETAPVINTFTVGPQDGADLPLVLDVTEATSLPLTIFVVGVPANDTAPSAAQIIAGNDATDSPATIAFNFERAASGSGTESTGPFASATYDFYCVARDSALNVSSVASDLDVVYTAPSSGIVVENSFVALSDDTNGASYESGSFTPTAGSNRVIAVVLGGRSFSGHTSTTAAIGGTPMTKVTEGNVAIAYGALFYMKEADIPVGSTTLAVSAVGGNAGGCYAVLVEMSGVDQTTTIGDWDLDTDAGMRSGVSLPITTTAADSMIISGCAGRTVASGITLTAGGGATILQQDTSATVAESYVGAGSEEVASSASNITHTYTLSATEGAIGVAAEFLAA